MGHGFDVIRELNRSYLGTLHIGANVCADLDDYRRYAVPLTILVEPQEFAFRKLVAKVSGDPAIVAIQALCGAQPGDEHSFFVASNDGISSSMLKPRRHLVEAPGVSFRKVSRSVVTTVDALMTELDNTMEGGAYSKVDSLTIEVQGAELHVLKGASRTLQWVRYVHAAVSTGGLYENDAHVDEVQSLLKCFGFTMVRLTITRHGWGNALFVKL